MAKVVYLSYEKTEGMMKTLGLEVVTLEKNGDFKHLVRQLQHGGINIIFVTEAIYQDYQDVIQQYNKEFEVAISVLSNQLHHHQLAQKRLKELTEEALGVTIS
ncbi:V-type ATP synthase subunit F [Vagococcus elongatus]|uniref:V-type ATP synthase subunit F n=1 Tax=Vagococcus elongatus TaxID=180344 RepID=A0A430AZR7_9ENTE|nr:V-type ATP synthase subunit F [Vagococcus elongatus]RSU13526.1 hypothetical protein CBF29_04540 [Vagococcus elongatus]